MTLAMFGSRAEPRASTRRLRAVAIALATLVLALLAALAIAGALAEPNTTIPAGMRGRHVQVGGISLRVLQRGAGRDLLLIHGSPGCIEDWSPLIDELSRTFRVTAFDRPGHGFSGDAGAYSLAYNAGVAGQLIDTLGLRHAIVVGHSYGGATALALAQRTPAAVDAYVALDSAVYTASRKLDPAYKLLAAPGIGMGFAVLIAAPLAARRASVGIRQQFRGRPPAGFVELRARTFSAPKVVHATGVEWDGMGAGLAAQSPGYRQIRRPLHILAQADDSFRRAAAERLHREVPGSTLRLLPGTGHYLQIEKTQDVLQAIRAAAE
jgi:pimeloyl-ACP methyl ester carboxylesterase